MKFVFCDIDMCIHSFGIVKYYNLWWVSNKDMFITYLFYNCVFCYWL